MNARASPACNLVTQGTLFLLWTICYTDPQLPFEYPSYSGSPARRSLRWK